MTDQVISHDGLALIENFEGCKLDAYQDSTGVWTIGYGHTSGAGTPRVHAGMQITQAEAQVILSNDLEKFEAIVRKHVTHDALTQHEFDALVSFVFNLGEPNFAKSTLLRMVNAGNMAGAKTQFARWTRAGGVVLQGLVRRRAAEASLFAAPDTPGAVAQAPTKPPVVEEPAAAAPRMPDDVLAGLADVFKPLETVADTVGSITAPASPSPGSSAPQEATDESSLMNPLLAISIIQQVMQYAPQIEHVIAHVPDIVAKGKDAIAALEKLDFATAVTDAKAIAADLGITQEMMASVISHATHSAPPAAKAA